MRIRPLLLALLMVSGLAGLLWATAALAAYARTKTPAAVQFTGVGPGGFKVVGKTDALELQQTDKELILVVPLAGLATGIALRDKHMRDKYLQIDKFPDTRLAIPLATLPVPAVGAPVKGKLKGMLSLHGKNLEQHFEYQASCSAENLCSAKGSFKLNLKDFDILVPSYLGVTMKPDIVVEATFEATR